jgi:hypothetical protein
MNNKNIWLAALGGALAAALIASLLGKKATEPFPLSPSNELDKLLETSSKRTAQAEKTVAEMNEEMQQS